MTTLLNTVHNDPDVKAVCGTHHGTQHSGDVDGIPPPGAVFPGITQAFRVGVQDFEADVQDSRFKLQKQ